jgi:TDG/mug DNA glycosylase family protein
MADCFEPIARADARVLVLGSVPGEASIKVGHYYAHPRNAFWPLVETILGDGSTLDYPARIDLVLQSRVALWDVLASVERQGSLDSAIVGDSEIPNDILGFLGSHPGITHIFFNGAKAESAFMRHIGGSIPARRVRLVRLPSTSPANAATPFSAKAEAWRAIADAARSS